MKKLTSDMPAVIVFVERGASGRSSVFLSDIHPAIFQPPNVPYNVICATRSLTPQSYKSLYVRTLTPLPRFSLVRRGFLPQILEAPYGKSPHEVARFDFG
jgi:hypothetical protein